MWSKTNLTSQQENNRMKNGEYAVEEKKVATDREYTVWEILQGNLKVWWLMLFGALVGALLWGATNITRTVLLFPRKIMRMITASWPL